jgi:NAD(P)-dependent dehydrogenase (short-subunit alcohol dehydrogenase family)
MKLKDKVVVVTGGANGIGRALCIRFASESARAVVVADLELENAQAVADAINRNYPGKASAIGVDVSKEADIKRLVDETIARHGHIDLFCSNAGIGGSGGGVELPNEAWQKMWEVNLMSHVLAARHVVPHMIERGEGYLLQTASAAGLLTQIGSATYSVTKHAAVALAEWLSITYGEQGIRVSCLCPQGVRTRMLLGEDGKRETFLNPGAIEPEDVAEAVVKGIESEQFLILPHPEVGEYFRRKASDYDRWLRGMRRLLKKTTE